MVPVVAHTVISAPREEVFDYVADLAARVAWTDHYMHDFHLTRPRASGIGAAGRFRMDAPGFHTWAEASIAELDPPRGILEDGRLGRLGRTRCEWRYEFEPVGRDATRVQISFSTQPATRLDGFKESLGARRWYRRQTRASLERLRQVFEERPEEPLARATVSGYEPLKAARFGA